MIAISQPPPDSLRTVLRDVFAAPEYDWNARVGALEWLRARWWALRAWFAGLEETHPAAYYALVIALTVVLLALLAHFGYVFWRAFQRVAPPGGGAAAFPSAPRDAGWHLETARRLAAEGRFTEALAHRFVALVLELGGRRALVVRPSKTPAEYVAEARLEEAARARFADLVGALYRHVFGGAPCTSDDWARFDREAADLGNAHAAG